MAHRRLGTATDPRRPAVSKSDGADMLAYGALEDRANRGARVLRASGLGRGDGVVFWLANGSGVFELDWAARRCGLQITPIGAVLAKEEASYIIANSGARLVVVDRAIAGDAALTGDTVEVIPALPRLDNGKLYKRLTKDRYRIRQDRIVGR